MQNAKTAWSMLIREPFLFNIVIFTHTYTPAVFIAGPPSGLKPALCPRTGAPSLLDWALQCARALSLFVQT